MTRGKENHIADETFFRGFGFSYLVICICKNPDFGHPTHRPDVRTSPHNERIAHELILDVSTGCANTSEHVFF